MSDNGCTANWPEAEKLQILDETPSRTYAELKFEPDPNSSLLGIFTKEDSLKFLYNGTVLHNDREIGKNQELIDEMLIFFKKANA